MYVEVFSCDFKVVRERLVTGYAREYFKIMCGQGSDSEGGRENSRN